MNKKITARIRPHVSTWSSRGAAALFAIAMLSQPLGAQAIQDFGYGKLTANGTAALGARPLLVILMQFDSAPAAKIPTAAPLANRDYDNLVFNYLQTSVNGVFLENSHGRFYWTRAGAGTYGPFHYTGDQYDVEDPANYKRLKRLNLGLRSVAASGLRFADFDANGRW